MTRASVAVTVAALLSILMSGCREEPTIVIKFEPNDMGGKVAATTKAGDLGSAAGAAAVAVADLGSVAKSDKGDKSGGKAVADKGGAKKGAAVECKAASDCVVEPLECCDCANGGKQHAVSKKVAAAGKAAHAARCKTQVCTMMLSTDPSCGMRADCVDGACVMVKKK